MPVRVAVVCICLHMCLKLLHFCVHVFETMFFCVCVCFTKDICSADGLRFASVTEKA